MKHRNETDAPPVATAPSREPQARRRLVDYAGASAYLGVPRGTLRARVHRGNDVPFLRIGPRLVRFDLDELDKWLETKRGGAR